MDLSFENKSDVKTIFPKFYDMIKMQFDTRIKKFRSENAKNYFN